MGSQIDPKLQQQHVIDQIRVSFKFSVVNHLILVAEIDVDVLAEGFINAEKEPVLVQAGFRPLARDCPHRVEIDEDLIIHDHGPGRGRRNRDIHPKHLAETYGRAVGMLDPPLFQSGSAEEFEMREFVEIIYLLIDSILFEESGTCWLIIVADPCVALPDGDMFG